MRRAKGPCGSARLPRARRRGGWPPAITSLPTAWRLLSLLYAAAGTLVVSTTGLEAASGARNSAVVQSMDGLAVVASVLILCGANRLPRTLLGPTVLLSSALITVALLASGGHSTAIAYACVYLIGPVYCRFVLPQRQADAQLGLILLMGVPALATQPGVGVGEQVVFWGVALMECAAVSWLVGALVVAESDSLTGLPNRTGLERSLGDSLAATPPDGRLSLVLLELDHFRSVNEELGHATGDQVLVSAADTWSAALPAGAVLGRISGDGFAIVLPGLSLHEATSLAERLRSSSSAPRGCSAGSVAWEPGESASMLLNRAEAAVYVAKHEGRGRTYEHPGVGNEGREIRAAVARGEFVVHLQPIVELDTWTVVGAEALVRWSHPERGWLMPGDFLPEAERSGAIVDLGAWVLREACRHAAAWPRQAGGAPLHLSVNASGPELSSPRYADTVEEALRASGLDAGQLILELVESDYDAESVELLANLHRLRDLGVGTAIDDFGTGHSSLDRLRRLGTDVLKIDRCFVADIVDPQQTAPLVAAIIALARALGLRATAEGVETPEQAEWLARHGCTYGQGWLFGRPVDPAVFAESLLRGARLPQG